MASPGRTAQGLGPCLPVASLQAEMGLASPSEAGLGGPWQVRHGLLREPLLRRFLRQPQDQWFLEAPGVSAQVWACPARPAPPLGPVADRALPISPPQSLTCQRPALAAPLGPSMLPS